MAQSYEFVAYRNQELFSDNYLKNRLPDSELWAAEGLRECRQQIAKLYEREKPLLPSYNEPQLEDHVVRPVLSLLGHCYEVQEKLIDQPDYAFFAGETACQAAHRKPEGKFWEDAIGLADAKAWDVNLDAKGKDSPFGQIKRYLFEYGIDWGILTNGRLWRLYHREKSRLKPVFYELNLPRLLEEGSEEDFKYFFLFFRRQAFYDPPRPLFLDVVSEESTRYAEQLQDDLKRQVYQALRYACQGFLSYKPNGLTAADFNEIHDNALVLLYRLLFILYAEARGLLPMDNAQYRERYSLDAIKRQATGQLAASMANHWPNVKNLCGAIDQGDEELGIPEYNGGLFDPQKHQFLEQKQLPDKYLAQVLDALACTAEGKFLDYSDLEVRHLGSIYEGLLEYKLAQATEPMVAVRRKGKELWLSQAQAKGSSVLDRCQPGELYLVTDRGERKATGSYYTPQYIVEYIVDNTVGPLVEECESTDDILQLNILDPAMGSGHFLVEATDYLARAIAEKQGENWDELTEEERTPFKRQVVERCIYGVDLNPLAVELAKLSLWLHTAARGKALNFLDHHLRCGNSLIGAKIEDLAAPPQIRQKRKKEEEAGQVAVFDYDQFTRHANRMVQDFAFLQEKPSETRLDVQQKSNILDELDKAHRRPYREIADLWCSRYFGNDYDGLRYNQVMGYLQRDPDGDVSELSPEARQVLDHSRRIAGQRHFFHWEIEFPEVFFDKFGRPQANPGFDGVIGNPPYGADFDAPDQSFVKTCYKYFGSGDSAAAFLEVILRLGHRGGAGGMIVPKSIAFYQNWNDITRAILTHLQLEGICDTGLAFESVNYETIILTGCIKEPNPSYPVPIQIAEPLKLVRPSKELRPAGTCWQGLMQREGVIVFHGMSPDEQSLIQKLADCCTRLEEIVAEIYRGLYIPDTEKTSLKPGHWLWVNKVPDVGRYEIQRIVEIQLPDKYKAKAERVCVRRLFFKVLRGKRLVAYPDEGKLLTTEKLVNVRLRPGAGWDERAVVAVINSPVPSFFLQKLTFSMTTETSRVMDQYYSGRIPLPTIDFAHPTDPPEKARLLGECEAALGRGDYQRPLELATKALATHAALYGLGGKPELCDDPYWKAAIAQADKTFPGREDFVHDLLAALAQRMIDLNKQKHTEINGFLRWLETEIGTSIEELSGKTIIKGYYEQPDGYDELLSRLNKNRKHLGDLPHQRTFQERLRQEYEKSMQQLTPVIEALVKTDHLIDQIVYALYGLTEEEIAIVEESRA